MYAEQSAYSSACKQMYSVLREEDFVLMQISGKKFFDKGNIEPCITYRENRSTL